MVENVPRWTKWWWLGFFGVQTWTIEERRARLVLLMIGLVSCVIALLLADAVLEWIVFERHIAAALAALASVAFGFATARPIAAELYPEILKSGDENAFRRLSRGE